MTHQPRPEEHERIGFRPPALATNNEAFDNLIRRRPADSTSNASPTRDISPNTTNAQAANDASETLLRRRQQNVVLGQTANTPDLNQQVRSFTASPDILDKVGDKGITDKEREKFEDLQAKKDAELEQAIARQLVDEVRSDYISAVDITTLQSRYFVSQRMLSHILNLYFRNQFKLLASLV